MKRRRVGRALLVLGLLAAAWAALVTVTGGFVTSIGQMRVSSRQPWSAAIVAAIAILSGWMMLPASDRRVLRGSVVPALDRHLTRAGPTLAMTTAIVATLWITLAGIRWGLFIASGSDVYGYVSQADLWAAHGTARIQEPLLAQVSWSNSADILSPLGYVPAPDRRSIVPVYPAGLPIVMAAFERIGNRDWVFYVVPLLAGLTVWMTYLAGVSVGGRFVGATAAAMLATSPVFVLQALMPMSDGPVAAWWTVSFACAFGDGPLVALGSGLAAGLAILTRPNLAPLAAAPFLLLVWQLFRRKYSRAGARLTLFALGCGAGCVAVGLINKDLYGSPLSTGYGGITVYYAWAHVVPNLRAYGGWAVRTQTPLIVMAVLPPFLLLSTSRSARLGVRRDAVLACAAVVVITAASYLTYLVFDAWFWLRFLLPAWPPLLILTSVGLVWVCTRLTSDRGRWIAALVVVFVVVHEVRFLRDNGTFRSRNAQLMTPAAGRYIAEKLPERAAILAMQQSGSVRYYADRLTLRYDLIAPHEFERVLSDLARLQYHAYAVLEDWEEPAFRARFANVSPLGALDWTPIAWSNSSTRVVIYDLAPAVGVARTPDLIF